MRALRILGLADGVPGASRNLVLEDAVTGEQFSARCDDRLLAAVRGDTGRPGQSEIDAQSQLRPKEIQARIRAGATVEQLAALAGTSASRVERFAYPVLLERASMAERAMKARPTIDGITAGISVADTVAATLASRGHDGDIVWDAYRDDDGWILVLSWSAGRSENRAHWLFHPGPDGGTLSARDDAAAEIVDPALRVLRPLRPVHPESSSAKLLDPTLPTASPQAPSRPSEAASRSVHPAGGKLRGAAAPGSVAPSAADSPASRTADSTRFGRQPLPTSSTGGAPAGGVPAGGVPAGGVPAGGGGIVAAPASRMTPPATVRAELTPAESAPAGRADATAVPMASDRGTEDLPSDDGAGVPVVAQTISVNTGTEPVALGLPLGPATSGGAQEGGSVASSAGRPAGSTTTQVRTGVTPRTVSARAIPARGTSKRGNRPAMPSWEDVLLGARSDRSAGH